MKLSVELFQRTVQQLKGGTNLRQEKRAAPRVGLRAKVQLKAVDRGGNGKVTEVWTRDISRIGIGVMSSRKFKVGDHYLLAIPHEDADEAEKPLALYCTVRNCQLLADGIYAIGFSFEDMRTKQFPARIEDVKPSAVERASASAVVLSEADEARIRNAILD